MTAIRYTVVHSAMTAIRYSALCHDNHTGIAYSAMTAKCLFHSAIKYVRFAKSRIRTQVYSIPWRTYDRAIQNRNSHGFKAFIKDIKKTVLNLLIFVPHPETAGFETRRAEIVGQHLARGTLQALSRHRVPQVG